MTIDEVEAILRNAAGNPTNGAVAEIIPHLAAAISAALNPKDE